MDTISSRKSQRIPRDPLTELPLPPFRRLRGYAFDPSYSSQLDTALINVLVFKVDWEDQLGRGPCGEYIEVVDYDPASNCFYRPVDLDNRLLLAQDGLAPDESNPQFHQQMVYAVAMTTIQNFERAMGRAVLWSPRDPTHDKQQTANDKGTGPRESSRRKSVARRAISSEAPAGPPRAEVAVDTPSRQAPSSPRDLFDAWSNRRTRSAHSLITESLQHAQNADANQDSDDEMAGEHESSTDKK